MTFEIVKGGAPFPEASSRKYPFPDMEVGDTFDVPAENAKATRVSATIYGGKHNMQFATRILRDEGVLRVKRIR